MTVPYAPMSPDPATIDSTAPYSTLQAWFDAAVREWPHRIALVRYRTEALDTPEYLTFRQLDARTEALAARISVAVGGARNPVVGLHLPHSIDLVAGMLATVRIGGIFVPLDVGLPVDRLDYTISDSGTDILLCKADRQDTLVRHGIPVMAVDRQPADAPPQRPDHGSASGSDLAYILYTSGSTGRPKGVEIENASITQELAAFGAAVGYRPGQSMILSSHISFDPWIFEAFLPLVAGGTLVVMDQESGLHAATLDAVITRSRCKFIFHTPTVLRTLIAQGWRGAPFLNVLAGGEALSGDVARAILSRCGRLFNAYGPTETTVVTLTHEVDGSEDPTPIGRPIASVSLRILDDDLRVVAPGEWGEMWIGGPLVGRGYHNRADLSADRFRLDPLGEAPQTRFYRTGDRVRARADNVIEYGGRLDDQIKINGIRIEIAEVEAAISAHPEVAEALVLVREWAGGDKMLVGYVVCRPGCGLAPEALRAFLTTRLLAAMVPAQLIAIDSIPIGPTGKVARDLLPLPEDPAEAGLDDTLPEPLNAFAGLVASVLRRTVGDARRSFVELGGGSLDAMVLIAKAEERFGRRLRLADILGATSLADLCARLEISDAPGMPAASDVAIDAADGSRLSFAEERFWLLSQLDEPAAMCSISFTMRLDHAPAPEEIERAWMALVERHVALRTTYPSDGGIPRAEVHRDLRPEIEHLYFRCSDEAEALAVIGDAAAQARARPFDLTAGPLHRVLVVKTDGTRTDIVVAMHHIIGDGWSATVLADELTQALAGTLTAGSAPSPRLAAAQQRQVWDAAAATQGLQFWASHLQGAIPALDLPVDRSHARGPSVKTAVHRRLLGPDLGAGLRAVAKAGHVTTHAILLASLYALVQRHTLAPDIVIGNAAHGRLMPRDADTVGVFLNVLPIMQTCDPADRFAALAGRVQTALAQAYDNADVPIEKILSTLEDRRIQGGDLIQVYFNMLDFPDRGGADTGPRLVPGDLVDPVARFDLTFYARTTSDGFELSLVHTLQLLDHETGDALLDRWLRLLQGVAADPNRMLAEYRLTDPPMTTDGTPHLSIAYAFGQVAAAHPAALAIDDGVRTLSYRELAAEAQGLAAALRSEAGDGEVVGICCDHDSAMVVTVLACALAGLTYVPIDPRHPTARQDHVIRDSGAQILVCLGSASQVGLELAGRHGLRVVEVAGRYNDPDPAPVDPDRPAYILYTSGSTGGPKGVVQTQANVMHHAMAYAASIGAAPGRRLLLLASYTFDAAVMDIFGALLSGASLHPVDLAEDFALSELPARLGACQAHVLHLTPTLLRHLAATVTDPAELAGIDTVVLGGETATRTDLDAVRRLFGPDTLLINGLGPTESTTALQAYYPHSRTETGAVLSVGRPVAGTQVMLCDAALRDNEVLGEIVLRGRHLALGYWRREAETRLAFAEDAVASGMRRYRTGDIGRRTANGEILYLGRRDDQVKLNGQRIELTEVEAGLLSLAGIDDAACVLASTAAAAPVLVAYVAGQGAQEAARSGRNALAGSLPQIMVPTRIIALDQLPCTATGKTDRRALAQRALPEAASAPGSGPGMVAPSQVLDMVRGVWCDVLGIDSIGPGTSFFELGGTSLGLARIQAALARKTGRRIALRTLLRLVTVEDIAAHITDLVDAGG